MRACASALPIIVPTDWPTLIAAAIRNKERLAHTTLRETMDFIVNLLQPEYSSETCLDSTASEVAASTPSDKCCSLLARKLGVRMIGGFHNIVCDRGEDAGGVLKVIAWNKNLIKCRSRGGARLVSERRPTQMSNSQPTTIWIRRFCWSARFQVSACGHIR